MNLQANTINTTHFSKINSFSKTNYTSISQNLSRKFLKSTPKSKKDLLVIEEISIEDFEESKNHLTNYSQKSLFDNNKDAILYKNLIESNAIKTKENLVSQCFNTRFTSLNLHKKFEVFIL